MRKTMNTESNFLSRCQWGYSLVELLVVLAIVAVLINLASPFLFSVVQDYRLTVQINQLVGTLQFSRSEAIKRGSSITVCSSNNGMTCGASWQNGWIVLSGSTVIKSYPAQPGNNTIRYNLSHGTLTDRILFDSRGFSTNYAGSWTLCDSRGTNRVHGIVVVNTGRILKARDANNNGIMEDVNGNDLSCP